jgi:hypothetical protein
MILAAIYRSHAEDLGEAALPEKPPPRPRCARRGPRSSGGGFAPRAGSLKPTADGPLSCGVLCGRMPCRMRAARCVESAPRTPPQGRGPAGARAGDCERPGTLCDQILAPLLGKEAHYFSTPASGSTAGSRSLRQAASVRRWRGRPGDRSCGHCRSRATSPSPRAWVGPQPPTRRPRRAPLGQVPAQPASVLDGPERRLGKRFA